MGHPRKNAPHRCKLCGRPLSGERAVKRGFGDHCYTRWLKTQAAQP